MGRAGKRNSTQLAIHSLLGTTHYSLLTGAGILSATLGRSPFNRELSFIMHRWTARLLVLVMLVPAVGPLAMAHVPRAMGPHCERHAVQTAVHCHGMTMAAPSPYEASLTAFGPCCTDHACCRGLATLRWAKVMPQLSGHLGLSVQGAVSGSRTHFVASLRSGRDSARAPPRI